MTHPTSEPVTLIDGFYKQQRDDLQEENGRLRDRILYLEEMIRRAAQATRQVLAEMNLNG